jgi:hypothetical protein
MRKNARPRSKHFAIEATLGDSKQFMPEEVWPELRSRLLDIHEKRLGLHGQARHREDDHSLNAPTVQAIPDVKLRHGNRVQSQ